MFGEYTSKHVGDYLAIVLDDKVISAPTINSAITEGKGQISGNFTQNTANDLMIQLKYGSLPIPFKVVQSQSVGATLGQDSIDKSYRRYYWYGTDHVVPDHLLPVTRCYGQSGSRSLCCDFPCYLN